MTTKERELDDYMDACRGIIRPQLPEPGQEFQEWITEHTPVWQRHAVVQIRRYLGKECGYGMSFDVSDGCWEGLQFYSFLEDYHDEGADTLRQQMIGGVAFLPEGDGYNLEFCWIHPFWRNQGKLRRAWGLFQARFGEFSIEPPVSPAMEGVLRAIEREKTQVE